MTTEPKNDGPSLPVVLPLPFDEDRNEVLTFADGTELEINEQMRCDCMDAYQKACAAAVSRRMIGEE